MAFGARKFYKINGLTDNFRLLTEDPPVFKTTIVGESTSCFTDNFIEKYDTLIDEHTILFITACAADTGKFVKVVSKNLNEFDEYVAGVEVLYKLTEGDTLLWARGDVYCVSSKAVKDVSFDDITKEFVFTYTDGTTSRISQLESQAYTGVYPIGVDSETKKISLLGIYFPDATRSFVIDTSKNRVGNNVKNAFVAGAGNESNTSYQHVEGTYADSQPNYAFVIGNGTNSNNRGNLFVITFNGISHIKTDFTAGGTLDAPLYRLSDIHSVLDVDWAFIDENAENSFSDVDYSNDYN